MATVEVRPFVAEVVINEWTELVKEVGENNLSPEATEQRALYIGLADEAEAKAVLLKIQRTANGMGFGARRSGDVVTNPNATDATDALLMTVLIGKKKEQKPKDTGVAAAIAKQK